jgi:hypothetical protein
MSLYPIHYSEGSPRLALRMLTLETTRITKACAKEAHPGDQEDHQGLPLPREIDPCLIKSPHGAMATSPEPERPTLVSGGSP